MPKPPLEKRLAEWFLKYLDHNGYANTDGTGSLRVADVDGCYDLEDLAHHTIEFLDWEGKQ